MASRLETALDLFLCARLGAERIDDLALTPAQHAAKKADYFLAERTIVLEMKWLSDARVSAVRRVVGEFQRAPDWPALGAELSRPDGASAHPRGAEFRRRVSDAASRSVLRCARSANQQIRASTRQFGLAGPLGVLLLLNERDAVVDPALLGDATARVLRARRRDGQRELAQLDTVVIVTAALAADGAHSESLQVVHADDVARSERAETFERTFRTEWSAFRARLSG